MQFVKKKVCLNSVLQEGPKTASENFKKKQIKKKYKYVLETSYVTQFIATENATIYLKMAIEMRLILNGLKNLSLPFLNHIFASHKLP